MYLNWKSDPKKYWILDSEADSLTPTRFWCAVVKNLGSQEIIEFDPEGMIDGRFKNFIESNLRDGCVFVCHNGISYDSYHLNRLLNINIPIDSQVDSLVLSFLYHPYLPGGHSLAAYGERFKSPKLGHEDWSHFSPEMMDRCRQDVLINEMTYKGLCDRMLKIGFSEKSCEIEHRIRYVIDKQERRGFYFDKDGARALTDSLCTRIDRLGTDIHRLFPPTLEEVRSYKYRVRSDGTPFASFERHRADYAAVRFNEDHSEYSVYDYQPFDIASPKQRVEKLLSLGWEPTEFTPRTDKGGGGNPKINEDALKRFADESNIPEILAIADWVVSSARKSMIEGWIKCCKEDNRIHGTLFTCGAASRRMRHVNPNTTTIPSEANGAWLGAECRGLWTATPGRVLVGYDASSLEMRGFGHYIGGGKAAEVYIHGKPHQINSEALTRALGFEVVYGGGGAKTLFYAFLYGAGDPKLGRILGKGRDVGAQIRSVLLNSTPGLKRATQEIREEFDADGGLLRCIDGGYVRCPSPHSALNFKIQSAGGITMKLASILLDKEIEKNGWDTWKVLDAHDEAQQDTVSNQAEEVGKAGVQAIKDAGEELGWVVPLDGEYKIGQNWHETH